jgi:hypothetical protein
MLGVPMFRTGHCLDIVIGISWRSLGIPFGNLRIAAHKRTD